MCLTSVKLNYIYKYDFSNLNICILLQIIQDSFHYYVAVGCCELKLKLYGLHLKIKRILCDGCEL